MLIHKFIVFGISQEMLRAKVLLIQQMETHTHWQVFRNLIFLFLSESDFFLFSFYISLKKQLTMYQYWRLSI